MSRLASTWFPRALLPLALIASLHLAAAPLIVVDDRGGVPAQPYYDALHLQHEAYAPSIASAPAAPSVESPAELEARMLPVHSVLLSPGDEPRRAIRAAGLTPIFLVGEDERSRAWLQRRLRALQRLHAVGLVVNVESPEALAALRRLAPGLTLSPVSGDDLARRLGIHHYPLLLTATGIEQ